MAVRSISRVTNSHSSKVVSPNSAYTENMAAYPVLRRFSPEVYLRLERRSKTRNEYVDGLIYAMAGGTMSHDRVDEH